MEFTSKAMNFSIEERKENDLIIKAGTRYIKTWTIRNLLALAKSIYYCKHRFYILRGGNMQLHVSVVFTSCGNVKIQVYVIPSRFRNGNAKSRFRHF